MHGVILHVMHDMAPPSAVNLKSKRSIGSSPESGRGLDFTEHKIAEDNKCFTCACISSLYHGTCKAKLLLCTIGFHGHRNEPVTCQYQAVLPSIFVAASMIH